MIQYYLPFLCFLEVLYFYHMMKFSNLLRLLFIVVPSYLKFKPDLMAGNFLAISNTADATCFDPPYLRSPATVPRFPVLTILPSNPIMLSKDLGFDVEYTKFVWHSGMYL